MWEIYIRIRIHISLWPGSVSTYTILHRRLKLFKHDLFASVERFFISLHRPATFHRGIRAHVQIHAMCIHNACF